MSNTAKKQQTRTPAIKTSEEEVRSTMEKVLAEGGDLDALMAALGSDIAHLTDNVGKSNERAERVISMLEAEAEKKPKYFTRDNILIAAGGVAVGVGATFGVQRVFRKKAEAQLED